MDIIIKSLKLISLETNLETRLRWFGHVQSRYVEQRMLNNAAHRRKTRRQQRRFMSAVKEDIQRVGVTEQSARNSVSWRQIPVVTPNGSSEKKIKLVFLVLPPCAENL